MHRMGFFSFQVDAVVGGGGGTLFTKMLNHFRMMQLPSGKSSIGKVANQFDDFSKAFTACNRASTEWEGGNFDYENTVMIHRDVFFFFLNCLSRDRSLS